MPSVIATHALTKRYGRTRGIESLDLEVVAGEVFGFLGPNGAGKTTTIRTLLDLLHPTSGTAEIFGLDSHRDSVAIRARLGNLPGDFACPAHMTGRDLLRYVGELRGIDAIGRAAPLAERFEANLDRRVGELSRGNRQKIGLIQALVHDPELLVLDEPTGGLDPLMQEEFLKVVAERRAAGRTVFLSSHDLDEVARACDRVGIIRDGRLVAVEHVAAMRERTDHTVTVRFADAPDLAALAAVAGVSDVRRDDGTFHLRVQGSPDPLIAFLAGHRVADLEVTHPTLEELFLTYYDREGAA